MIGRAAPDWEQPVASGVGPGAFDPQEKFVVQQSCRSCEPHDDFGSRLGSALFTLGLPAPLTPWSRSIEIHAIGMEPCRAVHIWVRAACASRAPCNKAVCGVAASSGWTGHEAVQRDAAEAGGTGTITPGESEISSCRRTLVT